MAGDWIKMRIDLQTHPKIVRILSATSTDKFRVLGGLHAVWSVFDTHSEDGALKGYTPELLDHVIGWPGFSRALEAVGWLQFDGLETLTLPEFSAHNGQSAKRRAEDQKRKKEGRQSVRNLSAPIEDKLRTREEKRREEEKTTPTPDGVAALLAAYHTILPNCQRIAAMPPKRKRTIANAEKNARAICRERGWDYGPDFWTDFFTECAKDPWLRGDSPNPKNPAWKQSLDVLLRDEHFAKVMDAALAGVQA